MTTVYFVRHSKPDFTITDELTRPLSDEGLKKCKKVTDYLLDKEIHKVYSSPYKRAFDTVAGYANQAKLEVEIVNDFRERKVDGGWIEERDGVTILHVSGTYYEMGYQHGYLLKDKIEQNYRAVIDSADPELYNYVLEYWNAFWKYYTTEEYIDEMRGLSDGSGKSFDDVAAFNLWLLFLLMENRGCMNMAAWGPATADGKLYHMSSADIPPTVKDPETGVYLHENQILMVREPNNCYASITTVVAGCHTICGGMNEKSISLGSEWSPSYDCSDCSGNEYVSQLQVLDHASSAAEAIAIKKVNRNGPWNLIICDGKIPTALVIESTATLWCVSTWDSPIESISPFWSIDHVVRRKNMFIHPLTAGTQRDHYDPRIYFILGMKKGVTP